jgi:hypothetical protein
MKLHLILFLTISLACASKVFCDEQHQHHHDMGDDEKIGTVNFPIQCNDQAKEKFAKAVALLHSFAYEQAEGVFSEVAAADPNARWLIGELR